MMNKTADRSANYYPISFIILFRYWKMPALSVFCNFTELTVMDPETAETAVPDPYRLITGHFLVPDL